MNAQKQIRLKPEDFINICNQYSNVILAFDYDGTLVNLHKDHNGAVLTDQETELLNELSRTPGTIVSIITGRAISNLKALLNGRLSDKILLYGTHGAEKGEEAFDPEIKKILAEIKNFFIEEPYIYFEEKPISLTIHYKEHPDREGLTGRLLEIAASYEEEFRVQQGHDVFEYLPKSIHKGLAIKDLDNTYPENFLVFIGDDLTDNFGFQVVNDLGGLSIQVSERIKERKAGYLIDKVSDTYKLIRAYIKGRKAIG